MSEATVKNQVVQRSQSAEVQESASESPAKAPSSAVQNLARADKVARARDYQQFTSSHDFRTVESGSGNVTIIQSQELGGTHDAEKDQAYGVSVSTHAQFRMFQNGGLNSGQAEPRRPVEAPAADESRELLSQGLRRGNFRV
jgi:hypothetical protein